MPVKERRKLKKEERKSSSSGSRSIRKIKERLLKSITLGTVADRTPVAFLDLGLESANAVLGDPKLGIPSGRIIELYSPEGHGKTTLGMWLLSLCQKEGGVAILADIENSYTDEWAALHNVDTEDLVHLTLGEDEDENPEGLEDLMEKFEVSIKRLKKDMPDKFCMILWDSVAGTPPKAELDGTYTDSPMAAQARALSKGLRRLNGQLKGSPVTLVCINQLRTSIGGWVSYPDTPGGRALKFYASVRAQIKRKGKSGDAIDCVIENIKNRLGPPFREAKLRIDFEKGLRWIKIKKKKKSKKKK